MRFQCKFCGDEIYDPRNACYRVRGWEQQGKSSVRDKQRTGEVAHAVCVDREVRGITPGQTEMVFDQLSL